MANLVEYVKTVWENGKTALNAARMNNMEQGISKCATQINKLGDSVSHATFEYQGIIGDGSLNWDTLESGRAIVQIPAGLTSESHAPKNAYSYGVLLTSNMGGDGTRYQIYIPNQCQHLYVRTHWSTAWTKWMQYSGTELDS